MNLLKFIMLIQMLKCGGKICLQICLFNSRTKCKLVYCIQDICAKVNCDLGVRDGTIDALKIN